MIASLGEALALAAQQRVEPETFFKIQSRSYRRLAFPNPCRSQPRTLGKPKTALATSCR